MSRARPFSPVWLCAFAACAVAGCEGATAPGSHADPPALATAPTLPAQEAALPRPAGSALPAPSAVPSAAPSGMPGPARARGQAAVRQNAGCVTCHVAEAAEWRASLHRRSDTDPAYRAAFAVEPMPFCRSCHAPEADPRKAPAAAVSDLGVGCVTCHLTDEGEVLAAEPFLTHDGAASGPEPLDADPYSTHREPTIAPHPVRRSVDFARTGGCAGCHEFRFPTAPQGAMEDAAFMQTTLREHARSPASERPCASCHLPRVGDHRSHAFSEVRDPAWLRSHLRVTAETTEDGTVRVTLAPVDPAHAFPTGDLFRRLEVGSRLVGPAGQVLRRDVRYLDRQFVLDDRQPGRALLSDDRLLHEPVLVELDAEPPPGGPAPVKAAWWVTYQRVATVRSGYRPEEAQIESEVPLFSGELSWESPR